jgi:hypothetical protein
VLYILYKILLEFYFPSPSLVLSNSGWFKEFGLKLERALGAGSDLVVFSILVLSELSLILLLQLLGSAVVLLLIALHVVFVLVFFLDLIIEVSGVVSVVLLAFVVSVLGRVLCLHDLG